MMLEGTNASVAIRWVRQDLDDVLAVIRDNLEDYAEDPQQRDSLKIVQDKLEQLNLTFLTMQQHGASLLTDEMIAVGGHMLHGGNASLGDSLAALTDAIIVLPSYLDRLQAGHDDLPVLLLPTLNELRATYDETLLSEGSLFAPKLDVMISELGGSEANALGVNEFQAFARRLRSQYQTALLGWLKEQSKHDLLSPLIAVCQTMHRRVGRHSLRRLWWIAEMTISGFRDAAIENDLPLRRLFARLDLNLKSLAENGEVGPQDDALTALSRALLFMAAQAKAGSPAMEKLRSRFKLDELIPDREALLRAKGAVTGRDAALFHSIGAAVREEMALVKDTLDMELRTGRIEEEQRESSMSSLQQLADTLHLLNLPVAARAVEDLLPQLEAAKGASNDELDSPLLRLARKLIEVESILETHIRLLGEPVETEAGTGYIDLSAHEQRQIVNHLLDECVISLQQAQDIVRLRLAGDGEADLDAPMTSISGALLLVGQAEVSELTDKLCRALNAGMHTLSNGGTTEEAHLDALTDAVAALELYLAGCRDEQANSVRYLEIMQQRLDGLPEASASGESLRGTTIILPEKTVAQPYTSANPRADGRKVSAPVAKGDQPFAIDPVMQEVFLEEFDSVLRQLDSNLPAWLADPANSKLQVEVRRGFHTLKGSGRMVGAMEVGDFAWRIEELLNRLAENKVQADRNLLGCISLAARALPDLKARLMQQNSQLDAESVQAFGNFAREMARGSGGSLEDLQQLLPAAFLANSSATADESEEATLDLSAAAMVETSAGQEAAAVDLATDAVLAGLMIQEIRQYSDSLNKFIKRLIKGDVAEVDTDLVRAIHTLASTLAMSPLGQEAEVARSLEHYLERQQAQGTVPGRDAIQPLQTCLHRFLQRLFILEQGHATSYPLEDVQLLSELQDLRQATPPVIEDADSVLDDELSEADSKTTEHAAGPEPEPAAEIDPALAALDATILAIFLEEAHEVLERCDTTLNTWRDRLTDLKLVQNLQREIHTFKGGARMAGLEGLGNLSHSMESLLERIAGNRLQATVAAVQALEEGCDSLTVCVEQLVARQMPDAGPALARFDQKVRALSGLSSAKAHKAEEKPLVQTAVDEPVVAAPTASKQPEPSRSGLRQASTAAQQAEDTEAELAKAAAEGKKAAVEAEPVVELAASVNVAQPEIDTQPAKDITAELAAAAAAQKTQAASAEGRNEARSDTRRRNFREVPDPAATDSDDSGSQQQIRVAAELMDSLVNYAGEISIYRARLEQQLGTVRFNLKEVEQTIGRLKEQLRKMDGESEAQMLSRYQNASSKGASDFDPLELDRFSNMQQLSRAITESISDLMNLQEMLGESVRQAETLLVQQSRVSTDLQEGLMQTRMTPFGSAAPRLRRVVRAAATETGKRARLQLRMAGSSDQLDRNVLERITAPLEHMLRNAVVHGIEAPRERIKAGKPEEGEIIVTVEAEATEFVLRVEDDGNGVNLEAVRKRAIERGLMKKSDDISEQALTEFIMESGFSTATTVTGLAGRGVGMDVVNSEIKQIGGSMDIASQSGQGTCFTIRIPFSLAVTQAIGVTVGAQQYFVPLNSVSGVARIMPAEYLKLMRLESPEYEFAGEKYPVLELEPLLGSHSAPQQSGNISLLMIRAGDHKAAFRVSELHGHQEVVMKPVGPQISSIPGILGATISADGRVVLILDIGPLIRRGLAQAAAPVAVVAVKPAEKARRPLVMVVDDSITMRKVTSRVLENHSVEVMTAQDGLDAIENLHDRIPDLMLLDIEMPRMDGYELAEHVRADPRLRHVPIVMITSRAGQKHRKRARDAGANDYMTKPYQEAELVAKVSEMLNLDLKQKRSE
ncbi:MAG: Hpt domain-containing protein [Xanthomonadales bacterium]|nr:Hpt domain-containing protein [Xanthomonadales bacterium]